MATAAAVDQDSDSDTEDFNADSYVRCPVCLDYYKEPKVLTCGHLVCCQCLVNWMTANVLPTTCPVCRANLTGDETGRKPSTQEAEEVAKVLMTDLSMGLLVEAHKQLHEPHVCGKCGEGANSLCVDCFTKLCRKCRKKHNKATSKIAARMAARMQPDTGEAGTEEKASKGPWSKLKFVEPQKHRIELISSLDPKGLIAIQGSLCDHHTENYNRLDYFCLTHKKAVCPQCVEGSHGDCSVTTAKEHVDACHEELRGHKRELRHKRDLLTQEVERLDRQGAEAVARADSMHAELDRVMDGLQERLQEARLKLITGLADTTKLSGDEAANQRSAVIREFRDKLPDIVNIAPAEAAVQNFLTFRDQQMSDLRNSQYVCQRHRQPASRTPQETSELSALHQIREDMQRVARETSEEMERLMQRLSSVSRASPEQPGAGGGDQQD